MSNFPSVFELVQKELRRLQRRLFLEHLRSLLPSFLAGLAFVVAFFVLIAANFENAASFCAFLFRFALAIACLTPVCLSIWRVRSLNLVAYTIEANNKHFADSLIATNEFINKYKDVEVPPLVLALAESVLLQLQKIRTVQKSSFRPHLIIAAIVSWTILFLGFRDFIILGISRMQESESLSVMQTGPIVGELSITIEPPEHTKRSPQTWTNFAGDFSALKGSRVQIEATALQDITAANLRVENQDDIALTVKERKISGSFVLKDSMRWRFALESNRRTLLEKTPRLLRAEFDAAPNVTLKLPAEDLELQDPSFIDVAFHLSDDFGLTRAAAILALVGDEDNPQSFPIDMPATAAFDGDARLDLSVMNPAPGDHLILFVEAYDNDSVDGPKRGVSASRILTIASPRKAHDALTERLHQLTSKFLLALADRVESCDAENPQAKKPWEVQPELQAQTDDAQNDFYTILQGLKDDPLTPEEVQKYLEDRYIAILSAAKDEARTLARGESYWQAQNTKIIEEIGHAIIAIEATLTRLALEDMAEMTRELQLAREDLKRQIEAYKASPSPELKSKIIREIKRLKNQIDELRQRMQKLKQDLPKEYLNVDGLKENKVQEGLSKSKEDLASIEKMLEEDRLDEALAALEEMAQALEELTNSIDRDMQALHDDTHAEEQRALSELLDETRDLMKQEEDLSKRTAEEAAREAKAQEEFLKKEAKDLFEELISRADSIRINLESLDFENARYIDTQVLRAQTSIDQLRSQLVAHQPSNALQWAKELLEPLEVLRYFATTQRDRNTVFDMRDEDEVIIAKLRQMMNQAKQKSGGSENQDNLAKEQEKIKKGAEQLKQKMERLGQEKPNLKMDMQSLNDAQNSMQRAQQGLEQGLPRHAQLDQDAAMQSLQGMIQSLKQAGSPKPAERNSRGFSHEKVDIPKSYQSPDALRRELLDAMKGQAPDAYQEQVKRYYEGLVQ